MPARDLHPAQRNNRICCASEPDDLEGRKPEQVDIVKRPEYQLRNLRQTLGEHFKRKHITETREELAHMEPRIPFRFERCPRSSMVCCGVCTRVCNYRCQLDVMNRAYLFCGSILDAPTPEARRERYEAADLATKMLYQELTSGTPRYFAIAAAVQEMLSPRFNKRLERIIEEYYGNEDSPHKLDYAPTIEYVERPIKVGPEHIEKGFRPKVNPETGEVSVLHWPRSGMCPYCLPRGLSDRRRRK